MGPHYILSAGGRLGTPCPTSTRSQGPFFYRSLASTISFQGSSTGKNLSHDSIKTRLHIPGTSTSIVHIARRVGGNRVTIKSSIIIHANSHLHTKRVRFHASDL